MSPEDKWLLIVVLSILVSWLEWKVLEWLGRKIRNLVRRWLSDDDATYISDVGRYRH